MVIANFMAERGAPLKTEGRWSCGPCPGCGGTDRFRVVYNPERGREYFSCRNCDSHGDDIDFLRKYAGMKFAAAKELAERSRGIPQLIAPSVRDRSAWLDRLKEIMEVAREELFANEKRLCWLREVRGLNEETARRFGLGLNTDDQWLRRDALGLSDEVRLDGRPKDVLYPAGIVIPILLDGELAGAQVRRFKKSANARYLSLAGSRLGPMYFRGERSDCMVIVESYLDGMLLWQQARAVCSIVALGSASISPPPALLPVLRQAKHVLVALDSDPAGVAQSWRSWASFPNATRCPIPKGAGKDPCEAWQNGLDLCEWIAAGRHLSSSARCGGGSETRAEVVAIPSHIRVGSKVASLIEVRDSAEAAKMATAIAHTCPAIGVAIAVAPKEECETHPHTSYHPKLSSLTTIAVYAEELNKVVLFDCTCCGSKVLSPLWELPVVVHDGMEIGRHIPALRRPVARIESTQLMANALGDANVDFDKLLLHFADIPEGVPSTRTAEGLAARALALSLVFPRLSDELKQNRVQRLYHTMRRALPVIATMEVAGVAFDVDGHKVLCKRWEGELLKWRLHLPTGLNINSSERVREWLVEVVPMARRRQWGRTKSGQLSTADDNLVLVADIPGVQALRECRRLDWLLSTCRSFGELVNPLTGRLHARWRLAAALTGRTLCDTPNLQAIPRDADFRALFHAPEGRRLLVGDVSQFQLRIAAHIAQDEAMLEAYERVSDLHSATAALLAGVSESKVGKEARRLAKAANFGLLFSQGVRGFREYSSRAYGINLSEREAARIRDTWLNRFCGIKRWHESTNVELDLGIAPETALRRAAEDNSLHGHLLPQALAFQVQGTEAEIGLIALHHLYPALREHNAKLVLFVHDEVVIEAPDSFAVITALTMAISSAFEIAFLKLFPGASVQGLVDIRSGTTWGNAE